MDINGRIARLERAAATGPIDPDPDQAGRRLIDKILAMAQRNTDLPGIIFTPASPAEKVAHAARMARDPAGFIAAAIGHWIAHRSIEKLDDFIGDQNNE